MPGDVSVWNQFTSRGISLSFHPPTGTGLVLVDASLGAFTAVPEPATGFFALALIAGSVGGRSRHTLLRDRHK